MISVVIPSYRNPTYLDLCLRSATENKVLEDTEIIVVLDGYAEESEHIIQKYPDVLVLPFEENKGQMIAHNTGVTMAGGDYVLIVNDDNVFPTEWDERLAFHCTNHRIVYAPNQIEPRPSIFPSFIIKDFGITPEEFQYDEFLKFEAKLTHYAWSYDGGTWPLLMSKMWYMILGGIDEQYPSAAVADHDFFLRCELAELSLYRLNDIHFYHFAGSATRKKDNNWNEGEMRSHEYFHWKWGMYSQFFENNSHRPEGKTIRGVRF